VVSPQDARPLHATRGRSPTSNYSRWFGSSSGPGCSLDRQGPTQQVALVQIYGKAAQDGKLAVGLDALDDQQ
jgi:hypothetical protein